jgi:ubiquinone/menaquinone biosynthesis C-methylase UbiE
VSDKFNVSDIQKLYEEQAALHGTQGTSTIQDMWTRTLEINALLRHLGPSMTVLEVGCGNGYATFKVVEAFPAIEITAFDFSPAMIANARKIDQADRIGFFVKSVLDIDYVGKFDVVYSQRCIQNLVSWDDQKQALGNIVRALKPGGAYIMQEGFTTGLNNLNEARAELNLEAIPESWHNHFFDERQTLDFMASLGCVCTLQDAFLSGYYFGSRVLLPALLPKGAKVTSGSRLNDYFAALPPAGDFCPMKLLRFEKTS